MTLYSPLKVFFVLFFCGVLILLMIRTDDGGAKEGSVGNETRSRVLSRSKRSLVFPDGSSLQLVFCVQTAALIPIGDIFLYGSTAALAWNLPTDPKFFKMVKEFETNSADRRTDERNIYYLDEAGKVLARVPYKRPNIINPAFAKRSIDDETMSYKEKLKIKIDRMKMHDRQSKRDYLKKDHLDLDSIEFHRNSRVDLYEKLVPFITALGGDGRQCVLYKLCEAAKISAKQGTFLQELLRVVFTLPKGNEFESEEHKDFDKAHTVRDDCEATYPGCADHDMRQLDFS